MDDERLADYLAGELPPDEQAAVEARLVGDPALRARLEHMRAADAALGDLDTPEPAPGFEQRLHAALAPELARQLGDATSRGQGDEVAPTGAQPFTARPDELARRRARPRRWSLALGGVAAGVALLAVVGVALSGVTGSPDQLATDDQAEMADPGVADDVAGEGPVLLASDRDLDEAAVAALLEDEALTTLAQRDLDAAAGQQLAATYRDRLEDDEATSTGAPTRLFGADEPPEAEAPTTDAEDLDAAQDEERDDIGTLDAPNGATAAAVGRPLDGPGLHDARRCLSTLLEGGPSLVPAYVEAADFQGEPVLVFGMLGPGADGEHYDRVEVWVLDRDECQVRTFQQRDP